MALRPPLQQFFLIMRANLRVAMHVLGERFIVGSRKRFQGFLSKNVCSVPPLLDGIVNLRVVHRLAQNRKLRQPERTHGFRPVVREKERRRWRHLGIIFGTKTPSSTNFTCARFVTVTGMALVILRV